MAAFAYSPFSANRLHQDLSVGCSKPAFPIVKRRQSFPHRVYAQWWLPSPFRRKAQDDSLASFDALTTPLLEFRDVTYEVPMDFENVVFKNANFSVMAGEFLVLTGTNGAGKSTALHLMLGFIPATSGKLLWKGRVMKSRNLIDNIGAVLQDPVRYLAMPTVLEELIHGRPWGTPDNVREVLFATGLSDISLLASPRSLSGGQTRRLALASQLMREPLPELFVLDEPLAGVDWTGREEIVQLLGKLKHRFAVIVVSHEPGELLRYADRVVTVGRGGFHEVEQEVIQKARRIRAFRGSTLF